MVLKERQNKKLPCKFLPSPGSAPEGQEHELTQPPDTVCEQFPSLAASFRVSKVIWTTEHKYLQIKEDIKQKSKQAK